MGVNRVNDKAISGFTLFITYKFSHEKKKSCLYIHECIVVTMMKCWWWNVKDLGQTGSDIKHMLTIGLHKNTTKYLFKKE